ncbi:hypothetical protein ZWY2020_041074 [Hordeum vulgare]|nr:hypothetical protein ZWY2020_041074 [Hordeum vulgare]
MSRYRAPRLKKIHRLGALPGLTRKTPKSRKKQKLHFHYGLTERQLLRYVLLHLLEMRLDNILFRLGMASTISGAHQLVNHRQILVNGRIVNIPSFCCKDRDIITTKDNQRSKGLVEKYIASSDQGKLANHLTIATLGYKGLVNKILDRKWVGLKINELLLVEYYSRQT